MVLSEEELIPLPLYKDMLDESMPSDTAGALSLSISSAGSSQHGSKEEFYTDDSFWEFINESVPSKRGRRRRGQRAGR